MRTNRKYMAFLAVGIFLVPQFSYADYLFHVGCQDKSMVVEWGVGDIDPGKEYLRVVTGTKHPGCSISDYNPDVDADLPREKYSDAGGVLQGFPPVSIICGIFGC